MGAIAKCCCDEVVDCCGALVVPTGWEVVNECCAMCHQDITEGWTPLCSDILRTDDRSASVTYEVYATLYPIASGGSALNTMPLCVMDPPPATTCTWVDGNGDPLPPCDDESLCGSYEQIQSAVTTHQIVTRYKRLYVETTIARVLTQCDAEEEPTCKWLVVSKMEVQVQWGQFTFYDRSHTIDGLSDCCTDYAYSNTFTSPTCEERVELDESLDGNTYVTITRSKYFTTVPSGVITFAAGDVVDCSPLVGACVDLESDSITINSIEPQEISWAAPVCNTIESPSKCVVITHFADPLNDPPTDECFYVETYDITLSFSTISGPLPESLLGTPFFGFTCQTSCGDDPPKLLSDGYISRIECIDLTSSHTDSGYTPDSITVDEAMFPPWTVDLESCT